MTSRPTAPAIVDLLARALGIACLCAALLAQAGRYSERLDIAADLAPVWVGGGLAAFVYGLFVRTPRRWLVLVPGGLAVALAGLLMLPELTRPIQSAPASPRTLRIIQFNTWDENRAVQATADWIAAQKPDVVVVEEAEPPIRLALAARGFIVRPGTGNVVIFSRAPPIASPSHVRLREWKRLPPFAWSSFNGKSGQYTVVGVHLAEPFYDTAPERRMFALLLSRYDPSRLILAGDFNLTPWSFALRGFDRRLGLTRLDRAQASWPARLHVLGSSLKAAPFLPIDHVYAGPAWRLVRLRRGPALGSDHFPLVVDLAEAG